MTTELANYDEILAKRAAELQNKISKPSGDSIKVTQSKMFKFPDGTQSPGPFEAIIVDFVSLNQYYEGSFQRDEVVPPTCFALGENVSELRPDPDAAHPQAESCSVCPHNQFGTGPGGRGKACKNQRLMAVLPAKFDDTTPMWLLKVSPTAIKSFDGYVSSIAANFNAPPIKVVTTIGFDPKVDYPSLRFGNPQPNPDVARAVSRMEEARKRLLTAPDYAAMSQQAAPANAAPVPVARAASRSSARVVR